MLEQSKEGNSVQEFENATVNNCFVSGVRGVNAPLLYTNEITGLLSERSPCQQAEVMKFAGDPASFRVVPRGQRKQVLSSNPDRTLHELNDMRFAEKYDESQGDSI